MSTSTLNFPTEIMAHVPVGRFDVVNGPGVLKCMEALGKLHTARIARQEIYIGLDFTLKTLASNQEFKRTLKMATIFDVRGNTFAYTAIFCNCIVSGVYNMSTRKGWFNLD